MSVNLNVHVAQDTKFETTVRELSINAVVLDMQLGSDNVTLFFEDVYQLSTWYASVKKALLGSKSPARR